MNIYLINLLRLIHIVAGILWAGAAISYMFFVKPSVQAIGAAGPQFMQNLMVRRKYPLFMVVTSLLTVLAGGALYWIFSGGFSLAYLTTGMGLGFTIGSLTALVAFLLGNFGIGPTSGKIAALGNQIAASGKGPTPDQLSQLHALEKKVSRIEQVEFVLLVISMVTMATARYWTL
ncbi:MAG: hypothetical protein ACOY16_00025 [Chloroflexota bacterium]